jgi:uncharacterized protein (TIGR02266 family)
MVERLKIRPTVLVPLKEARVFLDHYFNQGGIGGVFVNGNLKLASAEEVDLELVFAKEQVTVHARGVIRWKRLTDKRNLPAGIGVEFLPSELRTRDLLLEFAQGRQVTFARRRSRRYPAMIDIEYARDSVFLTDVTDDLSREGASVMTDQPVQIGEVVQLRLRAPGESSPIELKAEVRWRSTEGRRGFGVRFLFDPPSSEERVRTLVERIKRQVAQDLGTAVG